MKLDMSGIKKDLTRTQQARGARIRRLAPDESVVLRIVPWEDPDGKGQFYRQFSQWWVENRPIVDRMDTYGKTCPISRMIQSGDLDPAPRKQTVYLVNAFDVESEGDPVLEVWQLPASVWQFIVELLVSEEWSDVLDPKEGRAFRVKRTGSGLTTEYKCSTSRVAVPVGPEVSRLSKDPLGVVPDPGEQGVLDLLGLSPRDVAESVQSPKVKVNPNDASALFSTGRS